MWVSRKSAWHPTLVTSSKWLNTCSCLHRAARWESKGARSLSIPCPCQSCVATGAKLQKVHCTPDWLMKTLVQGICLSRRTSQLLFNLARTPTASCVPSRWLSVVHGTRAAHLCYIFCRRGFHHDLKSHISLQKIDRLRGEREQFLVWLDQNQCPSWPFVPSHHDLRPPMSDGHSTEGSITYPTVDSRYCSSIAPLFAAVRNLRRRRQQVIAY